MKKSKQYAGAYKEFYTLFIQHLKTLNYSKGTVSSCENNLKEYLNYIQEKQIELKKSDSLTIKTYFNYLEQRANKRTLTGLSMSYLMRIKADLGLFYDFLNNQTCAEQGRSKEKFPSPEFPRFSKQKYIPTVLTKSDIQKLFQACNELTTSDLMNKRNKTMLTIYYGLGVRRKEGTNLNVEDFDLNKSTVLITKSKTNQERKIPLNEHIQPIIEDYLYNVRERLIDHEKQESAFLVTEHGKRLSESTVSYILKMLLEKAKIQTRASPHTLRHSIATHLLQSGMSLENIARFLGHKSLDSTQIYTHLKQLTNEK